MNLRSRLFYSHLLISLLSTLIVVLVAGTIITFIYVEVSEVTTTTTVGTDTTESQAIVEEVEASKSPLLISIIPGFGVAIIVSTITALITSLTLSKQIVTPISHMTDAAQNIADGYYKQRITYESPDEIGALASHFNHMAESLDNTENTRRQLLADLTHEMNTPLTGIIGCIEGLQDGTLSSPGDNYTVIREEARRLQRLVQDVQRLSAIEEGIYTLDCKIVPVCDLLKSVADKLQFQYDSKNVQLCIDYPSESLTVFADEDRIVQVLINLLGNALQYTPPDGKVSISTQKNNNRVEFIITDTGSGIAESDLKQIFDRFYRVDKSRNRRSGGSGIGLTIARHLVEAHHGSIHAESVGLNMGSTFRFTLPESSTL